MMTDDRNEVLRILCDALTEFNRDLAQGNPIPPTEHSSLVPGQGALDSLGFVNLVSIMETHLERRFGVAMSLAETAETSGNQNPWQSVGALADFVTARLATTGPAGG